MLYGFIDESGEHKSIEEGGKLFRLTVGGALGSFDLWQALSLEWADMNDRHCRVMFHAADDKRDSAYLDEAFAIIDRQPALSFFGACVQAKDEEGAFKKAYSNGVMWVLKHLNQEARSQNEEFHLVVSRNREFPFERIERRAAQFERTGSLPRLSGTSTATPQNCCPLQIADLVAHAVKCSIPEVDIELEMRLRRRHSFYFTGV